MDGATQTVLLQQQEFLREIRDELRATRIGGAASEAAGSPVVTRPSSTFIAAQTATDRFLLGQWGSLGWAQSYQEQIRSSLPRDIGALTGFLPGPNTMSHLEFAAAAEERLSYRLAAIPGMVLAPGATRQAMEMGNLLQTYSSRFARAGDASVGPMGVGISQAAGFSTGRALQMQSFTDLRMSPEDYSAVLQTGLSSGQFDFVQTLSELKDKFTELKNATSDLTRTTRMSVSEVSNLLGTFRQMGVVDIGEQRSLLERVSSSARVAGLAPAEMAMSIRAAADRGLQHGIGIMTSSDLAMANVMGLRGMSRSGLLSGAVVAAGGGIQGLEASMTSAQQALLGSTAGYYALRGGPGRFSDAVMSGASRAGNLFGFAAAEAERIDRLAAVGSDTSAGLMHRMVDQQLQMMGITDLSSDAAQNMAFMLTRGQMGDAGALAFARSRSRSGRREALQSRFRQAYDQDRAESLSDYDRYFEATSIGGRIRTGAGAARAFGARVMYGVGDALAPGAGGYFGWDATSGLASNSAAIRNGVRADLVDPSSLTLKEIDYSNMDVQFEGTVSDFASAMGLVGAPAVAIGATALAATGVGLIPAAMIGLGASFVADPIISGFLGSPQKIDPKDRRSVLEFARSVSRANGNSSLAITNAGTLATDATFQRIVATANRGKLGYSDTLAMMSQVQSIASSYNMSQEDVVAATRAAGVEFSIPGITAGKLGSASAGAHLDVMQKVAGSWWYTNVKDEGGVLATTAGGVAIADLAKAISSGDNAATVRGRTKLAQLGLTAGDLDAVVGNIKDLSAADRSTLAGFTGEEGASRETTRRAGALRRMLSDTIASESSLGVDVAAAKLELETAKSPAELMALLKGGSSVAEVVKGSGGPLAELLSMPSDLSGVSDAEIAKRWFGGAGATQAVQAIRDASAQGKGDFRSLLLLQQFDPKFGGKSPLQSEDTQRASYLARTASALERLEERLKK